MLPANLLLRGQRLIEKGAWYFAPFSWLYALVIFCRNWLYDHRYLPVTKVPCTVVSVGNVVAGGTGKTPFVHLLAKTFSHRKVAILSRGYGSLPDEAMLLAKRLTAAKVYVGKDRVASAKQAVADGAELILLDDGLQHRRLHRDFDIVLGDVQGHYLPWGFLRDSPKRLLTADAHFTSQDLNVKVTRVLDRKNQEIPSIRGWKVAIFSGIAKPQNFRKTVEALGAEIVAEVIFADHEQAHLSKLPKAGALLCTEKDFVKLPPTDLPIYYLEIEVEIAQGRDRWEKVIEKIDQKIDNQPTYE
ncbi:MAG TPA: tetraacyldisaccharide 4'-kinase [Chlamydiales bacterium]|nr:tetraacyldisaccharide 4'-kinase [Chlamydiales bacterium]